MIHLDATEALVWGVVLHLAVDWLLQNDWIAQNKTSLKHPSAWVHAGMHGLAMAVIFPPLAALAIGLAHLLIDTRKPLECWNRIFQHVPDEPAGNVIMIWNDQVLHIVVIALTALVAFR